MRPYEDFLSVNEKVYRCLRDRLMRGDIAAGQPLGIEELAQSMAVSTMPVRAALQRLAEQQAIERTRSRSMRVPTLSLRRLEDIRRSRVTVEGALAAWATPRVTETQLATLAGLSRRITRCLTDPASVEQGLALNQEFHFTIYQAADSPTMLPLVESLWLQSGPYLRAARALMHRQADDVPDLHDHILRALVNRDASAARAATEDDVAWAFDRLRASPGLLHWPSDAFRTSDA